MLEKINDSDIIRWQKKIHSYRGERLGERDLDDERERERRGDGERLVSLHKERVYETQCKWDEKKRKKLIKEIKVIIINIRLCIYWLLLWTNSFRIGHDKDKRKEGVASLQAQLALQGVLEKKDDLSSCS